MLANIQYYSGEERFLGRRRRGLVSGVWVFVLLLAAFGAVLNVPVVWGRGTIYNRHDKSINQSTTSIQGDRDIYKLASDMIGTSISSSSEVGGYITANTTWTLAGSPYIVVGDVIIVPNVYLTIEPGVTVQFTSGTSLIIDGALIAQGNSTHTVTFTSSSTAPSPGDWKGITFRDTSPDNASLIDRITVLYAAKGINLENTAQRVFNSRFHNNTKAVSLKGGYVYVFNSTFSANSFGIDSGYTGSRVGLSVSNSSFSNNSYGIYTDEWSGALSVSNSSFSSNTYGIYAYHLMTACIVNSSFSNDTYGVSLGYRASLSMSFSNFFNNTNGIILMDCASLSVFDSVFFNNSLGIKVSYYIESISISVSNSVFLNNTYGILTDQHKVYTLSFLISNSIFSNNKISGIDTFGSVSMTHSVVVGNGGDGIALKDGGSIHYSNIYNNSLYAVRNTGSRDVNATHNWWGTTNTTQIGEKIYDYYDDYNLGIVHFLPILTSPEIAPPATLHDYNGLWHTSDFTITLTATDDSSGVAETYYKINDGSTKIVSVDGQPRINTEGANNRLEYWSVDKAGNEELPHRILNGIKLDKTSPTGSIIINNGDTYTTSTSVTLTLPSTDVTSGVYQVRFNHDGVWDAEPWESPSPTKIWILTSGDGTKTVYYQIKDNAGLVSITYSDTIILDTAPPTGSITIAEGTTYTNSTSVTLTLSVNDAISGISQMRFSNDNVTWSDWGAYSISKAWALTTGEGTKTVYVQFKDNAGLISQSCFDAIILDTTRPTTNAGVDQTVNEDSLVTFDASASQDENGIATYTWTFTDITPQTLTGKNPTYTFATPGTYTITLKVTDPAGNTATDTLIITVIDITITAVAGSTPNIDGAIAIGEWDDASTVLFNNTVVYIKQDGNNLYIAFNVSDPTLTLSPPQDIVAIFIDVENNGGSSPQPDDILFGISRSGILMERQGNNPQGSPTGGWNALASSTSSYWQAEFNITYAKIQITLGQPKTLGMVFESWNYEEVSYPYFWPQMTPMQSNSPSNWGNLTSEENWVPLDITKPIANAGQDQTVNVGTTVSFDAGASTDNVGIVSYEWDFGDGTIGTGKTPAHPYNNPGTYTVTLTVKDAAGNTATDTVTVTVHSEGAAPPPAIAFPMWIIGAAIAAIGIALAAIAFLTKRK